MGYSLKDIEAGLVAHVQAELPYLCAVEPLPHDFIDKVIDETRNFPTVYVALSTFAPFRYTEATQNIQINAKIIALQSNFKSRKAVHEGTQKKRGVLEIVDNLRTAFTNRWATLTDLLIPFEVNRYEPIIQIENVSVWVVEIFATDRFQLPVIS